MREHDRIATFFAPLSRAEPGSFSLTNDAAVLTPPHGMQLVITTDSVIESIHVPIAASPQHMARKLMRRNLSDIAAMGAKPWRYLLNIHTPSSVGDAWFEACATTFREEQEHYGLTLIGGDTTSGDGVVHLGMTAIGLIDGAPLPRDGAQVGDMVYVSGTIGDAALGLAILQHQLTDSADAATRHFLARYEAPEPRLSLGEALRGLAHAVLDCSDGLVADAAKLAAASGVGMTIRADSIPLSSHATAFVKATPQLHSLLLNGGDDYELIFTAPHHVSPAIEKLAARLALPLTAIGECTHAAGVRVVNSEGAALALTRSGYEH